MPNKTYSPVSPAQFVRAKSILKDHGFSVPDGDSGSFSGHTFFGDVSGTVSYDAHLSVLSVTVTQTTGFVSSGDVFAQIQSHLDS